MNVAVICEFSGRVRDAFRARGHHAVSFDLLDTEAEGPHVKGDCTKHSYRKFDLVICHPPCTYLCNSGVRWLWKDGQRNHERWAKMEEAIDFFNWALTLPVKKIAVENPVMHKCALDNTQDYTQTIQPWQFGVPETKRTCLWLKGLPPLKPTRIMKVRNAKVHKASPGPNRWKVRSITPLGIAKAMAQQWG